MIYHVMTALVVGVCGFYEHAEWGWGVGRGIL